MSSRLGAPSLLAAVAIAALPIEDLMRLAATPVLPICSELNASLFQRHEGGVLHVRTSGHANAGQTPSRVRVERSVQAAIRLAYQGGKAGVVVCDSPRNVGPELPESRSGDLGDATVCEELNASLALKRDGDVLHLRSPREPAATTELLNRTVQIDAVSDVPAIDALTLTIVPAMRGRASVAPIGTAGNGPLSQPVTLEGGSMTFIAALDAVVRQTSGLVWYVAFSPDGSSTAVGLVGPGIGGGVSLLPGPALRPSTP